MQSESRHYFIGRATWLSVALILCCALMLVGNSSGRAVASTVAGSNPAVTCPSGQCFTDVTSGNSFYASINALYLDGIVGGYPCGGTGEPCDAQNRPYYRPGNGVNRQQMAKFVDNGRRNIADAVGLSLMITSTAFIGINSTTTSGGEALRGECFTPSSGCWAVQGYSAVAGNRPGQFTGGEGVFASSVDNSYPGIQGNSTGATSAGGEFKSTAYRSVQVDAPAAANGFVQLGVQGLAPTSYAERIFNGGLYVEGDMVVTGAKTGYVVDVMQNVDSEALEPGDVVVIAGSSAPVLGKIPVVTVKKANQPYDTGIAGVVEQVLYVPDAATKAAYDKQQVDTQTAMQQRAALETQSAATGSKPDLSSIPIPDAKITDEQGSLHALPDATKVEVNGYANVVTLGAYEAVKVDASFGAIKPGDLLVASSHAGYAMKGTDKTQTSGAVVGKALNGLDSGTGTIGVLVTLK